VTETPQPNQVLRFLFWETTVKCNLSCAHCRRLEYDEAAGRDLTTDQAKNLIEQLADLGRSQSAMPVLVFSGGEPLYRDDLFDLIAFAKGLGIIPALATNGTLIDAGTAEQIRNSGIVRVAVSLDGDTSRVHDKLRRMEGSFQKAMEGIRHIRDENLPFQINTTLTRHNFRQLESMYALAISLGAAALHIFMLVPVGCGQTLAQTDMLSAEQYEQKMIEVCRLQAKGQLQVKVTCGPHYQRVIRQQGLCKAGRETAGHNTYVAAEGGKGSASRGCLAGLGVLFVSHQADVFPCGYLPVKCGNILETTLAQIWHGSKDLARMRDSSGLEGKCGICDYREVCGGCRARAYALTGNYMAQEPFCAYIPPGAPT